MRRRRRLSTSFLLRHHFLFFHRPHRRHRHPSRCCHSRYRVHSLSKGEGRGLGERRAHVFAIHRYRCEYFAQSNAKNRFTMDNALARVSNMRCNLPFSCMISHDSLNFQHQIMSTSNAVEYRERIFNRWSMTIAYLYSYETPLRKKNGCRCMYFILVYSLNF